MSTAHVRGSALLSLGRVVSLLFTVTTQILIVRALSKGDYGVFGYALALTSATRVLLSLGQNRNLSRSLALAEERGDAARLFGALVLVTGTILASSTVVLLAMLLGHDALAGSVLGAESALLTLSILLLLAPMEALDQVFVSLFAVFSRPTTIFFRKYVLTPLLRLCVVVAVILLDGGLVPLAIGYVGTQLLGLLLYLFLVRRLLRDRGLLGVKREPRFVLPFRETFAFSLPLLTTELVVLSFHSGNVLLLGSLAGAASVAAYYAVYSSARLTSFLSSSFETLYLPTASRLFARGDRGGVRDAYWHTAAILVVTSLPVFLMTVPFAEQTTVTLLGERYRSSAPVLALLASGYYLNACFGFNALTLQVYGRVRRLLVTNLVVAVLNIAVSAALIPRLGAVGVGVGVLAGWTTANLLNQSALRSTLGTSFVDRAHRPVYLRVAVAVAVAFAVDALLDPHFVVALTVGAVLSLAVLGACRNELRLRETFPELARVPLVGRFV